jgi:hypothetical protein
MAAPDPVGINSAAAAKLKRDGGLKSPLQNLLVRYVLGIEPDADGVFVILHGDEFGIALRGECVKGGDEVQFILAGGEERVNDFHGHLDFDFGLLGIFLIEDMDDEVVVEFGDAHVAILALNCYEFAVFGGADGLDEGAEVDIIGVGVVDLDLAVVEAILVDRGEDFFGQLEGDVDADGFTLGVCADNPDVQPAIFGCGSR